MPAPGPPTTHSHQETSTTTQPKSPTNDMYPTDPGSRAQVDVIRYQFYEKETGSKVCILESSAASWQSKISSLTQEVSRRLMNTSPDLIEEKRQALNT